MTGPNGAGKSTLPKTVLGTLRPSQGTITLDGKRISGLLSNQMSRRGLGYVPQVKDRGSPLALPAWTLTPGVPRLPIWTLLAVGERLVPLQEKGIR